MKTHLKEKTIVVFLALALALPVFAKADNNQNDNEGDSENNTTYVVTSVSPSVLDNNADTPITITGTGFSTITTPSARLGKWQDDAKDDTDNAFPLNNVVVVNDTTITATIPVGALAEDQEDITVYDTGVTPNTHYTLEEVITVHPSFEMDEENRSDNDGEFDVNHSNSNAQKASLNLTLQGKKITQKKWLKVRVGNRLGQITSLSKSGNDTKIRVRVNYGRMSVGSYNVRITYKDRLNKGVTKNGKIKYRKYWENGTITKNNAFVVN